MLTWRQVIKRTNKREFQQYIDTSDGQRLQWPPKALEPERLASASLPAV